MTDLLLVRSTDSLSIRDDGKGRTVHGRIVPYGVTARVSDGGPAYDEQFARGAFTRSFAQRSNKVRLYVMHQTRGRLPIGKAVELTERDDGAYGAFYIPNTAEGNDALTLVRAGVVDSFSVGFRGIQEKRVNNVRVRTEAALREVSLVGEPAYADAQIAGIRSNSDPLAVSRARLLLSLERARQ